MMNKKILITWGIIAGLATGLWANEPEKSFEGFIMNGYSESGEKSWILNGDTANIVGSEIWISNVDAHTLGEEPIHITSEIGIMDQVKGIMHLEKDVIITSQTGAQMFTDSLDWNRSQDLVKTEDDVLIIHEKLIASGSGLKGHPNLMMAKILKNVTVRFDTAAANAMKKKDQSNESEQGEASEETLEEKEGEIVTIMSDGPFSLDQNQSLATFEENVVAFSQDRTVYADRMEIYLNGKENSIDQVVCIGNVVIVQDGNKSYAEKAVYKAVNQNLVLLGRPKLKTFIEDGNGFTAFGN